MKFNFKKITPILAGALLLGSTLGFASAADYTLGSYPAPFVKGGLANVAIVYGEGSPGNVDNVPGFSFALDLGAKTKSTSSTSVSGESVPLGTSNNMLYMNDSINKARTTITKTNLGTVLADGTLSDDNGNDYDYTQQITLGSSQIVFGNSGQSVDPVPMIQIGTDSSVPAYTYKLTFSKNVNVSSPDVQGNTFDILGQEYTIGSSSTNATLYLYGAGASVALNEGENATITVGGVSHVVKLNGVSGTTQAQVTVDGIQKEVTEGSTYKFGDFEVYAKNIFYLSKENQVSSADLNLGSTKLKLTTAATVKEGSDEDSVRNTLVTLTASGVGQISAIQVAIAAQDSDEDFVGVGNSFTDPVFGGLKLQFATLAPTLDDASREAITLSASDRDLKVKFTSALAGDNGEQEISYLHDDNSATSAVSPRLADSNNKTIHILEGEEALEDDYIVVNSGDYGRILQIEDISINYDTNDEVRLKDAISGETFEQTIAGSDGKDSVNIDGQTYYINATGSGSTGKLRLTWGTTATFADTGAAITLSPRVKLASGEWIAFLSQTTLSAGNYILPGDYDLSTAGTAITNNTRSLVVGKLNYTFTDAATTTTLNGVKLGSSSCNLSSTKGPSVLVLEEKKSGETTVDGLCIGASTAGTSTVKVALTTPVFADTTGSFVALDSDDNVQEAVDKYGTLVTYDTSNDQGEVIIAYPDDQMESDIVMSAEAATVSVSTAGSLNVAISDTEALALMPNANLIVLGGAAVNKVSANLLGVTYPSYGAAAFKDISVGKDQALLMLGKNTAFSDKVALLVAGWEAKDTKAAANALISAAAAYAGKSEVVLSTATETVSIVSSK